MSDETTFGFPDFWPKVYGTYKAMFETVTRLFELSKEMFAAAEKTTTEPVQKVVYVLTRSVGIAMNDVLLLCGNGSGVSAMKLVRGMFETTLVTEYLRRNPGEVEKYIDFGRVLAWRRHQWLLKNAPEDVKAIAPEKIKRIEEEYNRVKDRFTTAKGKVRHQWSEKSVAEMAESMGRTTEYELVYSLGSSMHHANAEGLLSHIDLNENKMMLDWPPSMDWVAQSLIAAHTNFLISLDTLNECCKLGFDEKIKAAQTELHESWEK